MTAKLTMESLRAAIEALDQPPKPVGPPFLVLPHVYDRAVEAGIISADDPDWIKLPIIPLDPQEPQS